MEKEYLSVKDFARAAGVTEQAVYKQLSNKLKPYLKETDEKKMIATEALNLFAIHLTPVEQRLFNQLELELEKKDALIQCLQEERKRCQKLLEEEKKRYQKLLDEERQERKESNLMKCELERQLLEQTRQKETMQQVVQQFTNMLKIELEGKRERISELELQTKKKQWWQFWKHEIE